MLAKAFRWSADDQGEWLCVNGSGVRALLATIEPGKQYEVIVKEKRNHRSLDANAYCWVLLDKLAEKLCLPKIELYRRYIKDIGGNSETVCIIERAADKLISGWEHNGKGWVTEKLPSKLPGCVNVVLYYGSSVYDAAQMSRLINLIAQDAKEQGIETLTPDKLEAMQVAWA